MVRTLLCIACIALALAIQLVSCSVITWSSVSTLSSSVRSVATDNSPVARSEHKSKSHSSKKQASRATTKSHGSSASPNVSATNAPPAGPEGVSTSGTASGVVVGSGGSYSSVQAAVTAAASRCSGGSVTVSVGSGTYNEQVIVPATFPCKLILRGPADGSAVITNSKAGSPYPSTATMVVRAKDVAVYNLHVVNSRGKGIQALALYADGPGRQAYYNCKFDGYQDTVFGSAAQTYFSGCTISGAADFIWGQRGNAWYDNCRINVVGSGWITAGGRDQPNGSGYIVLNKCSIDGQGKAIAYLGRPWQAYARVVIQNTQLGAVVRPQGWDRMGADKPGAQLAEYGNTGPGARRPRGGLGKTLSAPVSLAAVFGDDTSWISQAST